MQDDPEEGFSLSYPRSSRGQALLKQVSILWIPGACPSLLRTRPGVGGMTTGGVVKYVVPF